MPEALPTISGRVLAVFCGLLRIAQDREAELGLAASITSGCQLKPMFMRAGDLMTVLLLAWLDAHPHNLKHAVEKAVAALQGVLQATAEAAGDAAFTKERDAKVRAAAFSPFIDGG